MLLTEHKMLVLAMLCNACYAVAVYTINIAFEDGKHKKAYNSLLRYLPLHALGEA